MPLRNPSPINNVGLFGYSDLTKLDAAAGGSDSIDFLLNPGEMLDGDKVCFEIMGYAFGIAGVDRNCTLSITLHDATGNHTTSCTLVMAGATLSRWRAQAVFGKNNQVMQMHTLDALKSTDQEDVNSIDLNSVDSANITITQANVGGTNNHMRVYSIVIRRANARV